MTFEYGTTRFVFCVRQLAFKFARVRIIDAIHRIKKSPKTLGVQRILMILQFLSRGITANIEEFEFYQRHPQLRVAPTLFSLFGLVNIQVRGSLIDEEDLCICPFREMSSAHVDLKKPENFVRIKGTAYLADYGNKDLNIILAQYAESLQMVYEY